MNLVDRLTPSDFSDEHKIIGDTYKLLDNAIQGVDIMFGSGTEFKGHYGILEVSKSLMIKSSSKAVLLGYGLAEGNIYCQMSGIFLNLAEQIKTESAKEGWNKDNWNSLLATTRNKINDVHLNIVRAQVNEIKALIRANVGRKTYDLVRLTVDIMNSIGACVVAGNVRRSSMLATGEPDCTTFRLLKDYQVNPERTKIGAMSNNSIKFFHTSQYTKYLPECAHQTALNGEPGYLFLLNVQRYGRIGHLYKPCDPITRERELDEATIPNPCSEIPLRDKELCCVIELPINRFLTEIGLYESSELCQEIGCPTGVSILDRHPLAIPGPLAGAQEKGRKTLPDNLDDIFDYKDFLRSCILAVIYGKSVSILPTNEPLTNAVIRRNHRIGVSITGGAQVHDRIGMTHYIKILRAGYNIIRKADCWLSNILGVRESLRVSTCKPSGTVSLLSGSTPGIHFCHSRYIKRRIRLASTSKLVQFLVKSGYPYEKDVYADNTLVFTFGLDYGPVRSVQEVTMYEQLVLLQMYQREWADNMVSVTVTFDPERESQQLEYALPQLAPTIKSVSFLPNIKGLYEQMPLEETDEDTYLSLNKPLDFDQLTDMDETGIPSGCTNDHCNR
jgi:ribonucleoside-diphosphate reductase alpha chain